MNRNLQSPTYWNRFRLRCERLAKHYKPGDVVIQREGGLLGIVTEADRGMPTVVFANGERRHGAMLGVRHIKPRRNIPVPDGALGNRGWNREQAVTAALRRAGIEVKR